MVGNGKTKEIFFALLILLAVTHIQSSEGEGNSDDDSSSIQNGGGYGNYQWLDGKGLGRCKKPEKCPCLAKHELFIIDWSGSLGNADINGLRGFEKI